MMSKFKTALQLLGRSSSIFLHLDSRLQAGARALSLPASLLGRPQVVLQIGPDMPVPIPDLQITESGVTGTLSFRGHPFLCVVPWDAVKAIACEDGQGVVFDAAWEKELSGGSGPIAPAVAKHPSERPYLRRVK